MKNNKQQLNETEKQQYADYVKEVTPTHSLWMNMVRAFLVGGAICAIGQGILNYVQSLGLDEKSAGTWTSIVLVLMSIILTGFNLDPSIAKFGGAGALVPITGFANSVVSPAIEFKAEGWVTGVGAKIFTIAGPVIAFGTLASFVWGVVYWLVGKVG